MAHLCGKEQAGAWVLVLFMVLVPMSYGTDSSAAAPEWRRLSLGANGGYEGLTVAVTDGLEVEDRQKLLEGLKELLRRTSDLLFEATEGRIFFSRVVLLVPASWNMSSDSYLTGRLQDATIRIDAPNSIYGHLPYAHAVRPCGQGGEYIHLTPELVTGKKLATERVGDVARALVHVWARYRWGLFEEYGHPGDDLHPYFRSVSSGDWEPTGCSSGYRGKLRTLSGGECRLTADGRLEEECRFFPDERNISATTSIMYQHNGQAPPTFCSEGTHDRIAPNRQNDLCNHRSSWSVMKEHKDFKTKPQTGKKNKIRFHLAKYSGFTKVNVLVVLDVSKSKLPSQLWKYLRTELKIMVEKLPYGSVVGVATYEGDGKTYKFKELAPLSRVLSAMEREAVIWTMDSIKMGEEDGRDPSRALEDAARMIERADPGGEVLLVFTQVGQGSESDPLTTKIPLLHERMARVVGLTFLDPSNAPEMPTLCLKTGGRSFTTQKASLQEGIKGYVEFVLSWKEVDNRLYQTAGGTLQPGPEESSQQTFYVEENLGRLPSVSIEVVDGALVWLKEPSGKKTDITTSPSCILVRGQHHCQFDDAKPGNWTINVKCTGSSCNSQTTLGFEAYSYQRLASRVSGDFQPTVSFWTSGSEGGVVDLSKEDLLVYAEIRTGYVPLLGLEVTVMAESANKSESLYSTKLLDDGFDPDVTANDGVYTGIVQPESDETLLLSLSIKGKARTPKQYKNKRWSVMPLDQGALLYGSNFDEAVFPSREYVMQRMLVKFTTVKVKGVVEHIARPQRISDLMVVSPVKYSAETAFVTLRWTSPQPRDGTTKVKNYRLYFSPDMKIILQVDPSNNRSLIDEGDILPPGGLASLSEGEKHTVIYRTPLKHNATAVYFRIQSINSLDAKSDLSRVVPVYLRAANNNSTPDSFAKNELTSVHTSRSKHFHVRTVATTPEKRKKDDLLSEAMALQSNMNKGKNSTTVSETPLTHKAWFVAIIVTVCVVFVAIFAVAVTLFFRSRGRERQNSLKEAMLGWSCLKGGVTVFRKGDTDEERGDQLHKSYEEGVWNCMSRGYPSTVNLSVVASVGRVEARKWVSSEEVDGGSGGLGNVGDENSEGITSVVDGPYEDVFIRHPNDVTTEL